MSGAGKSSSLYIYAGAGVLLLALAAWLALRPGEAGPVEVGERVPDFDLPLAAAPANHTALRDYRDRVLVLNFWATWCPPCVEETPSLEKFAEQMRAAGIEVIGVSVDQDPHAIEKFVADYHLTYPIARDPQQTLAHQYGTFKFPETYIIDRRGRLAEKIISNLDWQDPRIIEFVKELAPPPRQAAVQE